MREDAVFIALGSNLGDREAHLEGAVAALGACAGIELLASSRVYETAPVGAPPQGLYLNAVLQLRTTLSPRDLLTRQLEIEASAGRERGEPDSPRTLDLDLLFFGARIVDEPGLVVPHPRLTERAFVLEPLCDLAPQLMHPILGLPIRELARRVRDPEAVKRFDGLSLTPTSPTGRSTSIEPA